MQSLNQMTDSIKRSPLEEKMYKLPFEDFITKYYVIATEAHKNVCTSANKVLKNLEKQGHLVLNGEYRGVLAIQSLSKDLEEIVSKEVQTAIITRYKKSITEVVHEDVELAERYLKKKENAMSRGIEFNLSFSDYKKLGKKTTCHYSGIKFSNNQYSGFKRSLDRIDCNLGYTKENTVACCVLVNSLKENLLEGARKERLTKAQLRRMLNSFIGVIK